MQIGYVSCYKTEVELKYKMQPKMLWLRKSTSNSDQNSVQLLGVSRHAKKGQGKDMLF